MSRWPSKRMLQRAARKVDPDANYVPQDSAHLEGSVWDEWDDAGIRQTTFTRLGGIDGDFDELQR
jgi:hypothetical protein